MLSVATLGMSAYGIYSVGWAVNDLLWGARLELWADLGMLLFGALLGLSAALVRANIPGGLAFAVGSMLGLQALAVHNAVHLESGMSPQIGRAALAVVLVALASAGSRREKALRPG